MDLDELMMAVGKYDRRAGKQVPMERQLAKLIFRAVDIDGSGTIDKDEVTGHAPAPAVGLVG